MRINLKLILSAISILIFGGIIFCFYSLTYSQERNPTFSCQDARYTSSLICENKHPRIWITPKDIPLLKEKANEQNPYWRNIKRRIEIKRANIYEYSLAYLIENNPSYCREAKELMEGYYGYDIRRDQGYDSRWLPPMIAIAYDWCYPEFTSEEKEKWVQELNRWRDVYILDRTWADKNPADNYFYGDLIAQALTAISTYEDNPRAQEFLEDVLRRYENLVLPFLNTYGKGGDWEEGWNYGPGAVSNLLKTLLALKTAGKIDYLKDTEFFKEVGNFFLHATLPSFSHIYPGGDWSRESTGRIAQFHVDLMMLIMYLYKEEPLASYIKFWLQKVNEERWGGDDWERFLWDTKEVSPQSYFNQISLDYLAQGTGLFLSRSDWTPSATWISFKCGARKGDHSHADQGTFTIFKYKWLAPDANIYSHSGIIGQTWIHNGILINGEGEYRWHSSEGKIEKYNLTKEYVYIVGDITQPYNERKNRPIVEAIKREFLFLKPNWIIIVDRIKVEDPTYTKEFLLHSRYEPLIDLTKREIKITNGEGRLFSKLLFPTSNFRIEKRALNLGRTEKDAWEIKTIDYKNSRNSLMIHVLFVTDKDKDQMPSVKLDEKGNYYEIFINDPLLKYKKILFHKSQAGNYKVENLEVLPKLTLVKESLKKKVNRGEELVFKILAKNSGSAEAKNIHIIDRLKPEFFYQGMIKGGKPRKEKDKLIWTIPRLLPKETVEIKFKVKIK